MTTNIKNRITSTEFNWHHSGVAEIAGTFTVSAARADLDGRWKLMKVHGKSFVIHCGPYATQDLDFNLFKHRCLFKAAHSERDGTINDAALIKALDDQERQDDIDGKCFVPC